jgi:hypothetical protein
VLARLASMQHKLDAQGAYWAKREHVPSRSARVQRKS